MSKSPIKCTSCHSDHYDFVPEYHKCIWLRVIVKILQVIFWGSLIIALLPTIATIFSGKQIDPNLLIQVLLTNGIFLGVGVLYAVLSLVIYITESKTHIVAVCRDCGKVWKIK